MQNVTAQNEEYRAIGCSNQGKQTLIISIPCYPDVVRSHYYSLPTSRINYGSKLSTLVGKLSLTICNPIREYLGT